jgi:hypothetical protein
VIAGDPGKSGGPRHRSQHTALVFAQPVMRLAVMEGIAQRNDPRRLVTRQCLGHPQQGGAAVIGRQELPAAGIGTALFQMQVGKDQDAMTGQECRAAGIEQQRLAIDVDQHIAGPGFNRHAWHPVSGHLHSL